LTYGIRSGFFKTFPPFARSCRNRFLSQDCCPAGRAPPSAVFYVYFQSFCFLRWLFEVLFSFERITGMKYENYNDWAEQKYK
jgi:hypothetical protein